MCTFLRVLVVALTTLIACAITGTTAVSAASYTYDAATFARVDVRTGAGADAGSAQLTVPREGSASPPAGTRGPSTTFLTRNDATEAAARPVYPPNRGFEFDPVETTLKPGASIDRYGPRSGTFASPEGTPFGQRSLPASAATKPYEAYEVLKPIEGVNMGPARPWFGQPGLGVQYELPAPIQQLIDDGYLGVKK